MTNSSSLSWKTKGTLATLLLPPSFLTSVIALAPLWTPLVQKWSLYENGKKLLYFVMVAQASYTFVLASTMLWKFLAKLC